MDKNYSFRDIAKSLGRSVSTISEEIRQNSVKGEYRPAKAHHKAYVRRKYSKYQGKKIVSNRELRGFVEEKLYDDQSPQAIAGRLKKREKHLPFVSKDSIYRYIKSVYGRQIEYFRTKRKARRWKHRARAKKLKDRVFIDKRPLIIDQRKRLGDAESDFIESGKAGKGLLLAVVDRKSRMSFLEKITKRDIIHVHQAFGRIKERFPEMRTITTDNDLLMQKHQELEQLLKVKIYFCHPYHSWEKGAVENINKQIRKDIPKSSDISKYSRCFIRKIEDKLNRRILQCLDYQTPNEVMEKQRNRKT